MHFQRSLRARVISIFAVAATVTATAAILPDGAIAVPVAQRPNTEKIASAHQTCVVVGTGSVRCWGYNNEGQLGGGTALTDVDLSGATAATVAGTATMCVLLTDGNVRCWGSDTNGNRGGSSQSTNINFGAGITATQIASIVTHSCALVTGGEVRCWGENSNGALGGSSLTSSVPLGGLTVKQVAVSVHNTCVVLASDDARAGATTARASWAVRRSRRTSTSAARRSARSRAATGTTAR